jgi:hypothetical protein
MKTMQKSQQCSVDNDHQRTYEVPAIIYEGTLTTRAGSPEGRNRDSGIDPADLFGTDN